VIKNIFSGFPKIAIKREIPEALLDTQHLKLERILSAGQRTPPGEWYDQNTNEWVILLSGGAGLLFEGEAEACVMRNHRVSEKKRDRGKPLRIPLTAWSLQQAPLLSGLKLKGSI